MEPLIRVQNLMKIYNPGENEVRALDDVSLDIGQGEFVAIIGQSGSEIRNQEIGFIFQGFNLIQNLTALENVELPLIYRNVPAAERRRLSEESLKRVGLEKRMDHKPTEMSGGQQQRVAVARALIAGPNIIFADEPTGNLDTKSGNEVMDLLAGIQENMNKTLIVITHDQRVARMAKRQFSIVDGILTEVTAS